MKRIFLSLIIVLITVGAVSAQGKAAPAPKRIAAAELQKLLADPALLLVDVRTMEEYKGGHIPGADLFPYDEIDARKAAFAKLAGNADRKIVVYCRSGRRSAIAAETLVRQGYTDVSDFGAIGNWVGKLVN
jgi:rhodanese-related sulfurtransferase